MLIMRYFRILTAIFRSTFMIGHRCLFERRPLAGLLRATNHRKSDVTCTINTNKPIRATCITMLF